MNRILKVLIVIAGCVFLSSCGGQDEEAAATSAAEAAPSPERANNPLARQQQLIRDSKSIQGILDKNAEEKKKALDNIN
ncbi:MAG: hypothetical protein O6945_14125 [Gammaproteobacteria bacterium]|nr:hypothetical protein [Gammaproteobacteria bacterium]